MGFHFERTKDTNLTSRPEQVSKLLTRKDIMRTLSYLAGIAIGIFGIVIFHPLLTLIGIGLTLLVHLPKEENNA